jgi:hypothetical protein
MPVRVGYPGALGDIPGGDRTHPNDVVFQAGTVSGARTLTYQALDAQRGEVTLRVNWHPVEEVPPTPPGAWGAARSVRLPGRFFRSGGDNIVSFTAQGGGTWGVRTLSISR